MVQARSIIGTKLYSLIAAGLVFALPAIAIADGDGSSGYHHGMFGGGWGWGWGAMLLGPVMMIAVLAAVVFVVVLIIRWLGGETPGRPSRSENSALDILRERFARGEIDKDEFEQKRRALDD